MAADYFSEKLKNHYLDITPYNRRVDSKIRAKL